MGGHFKFDKRKQDTVTLRQCLVALEKAAAELLAVQMDRMYSNISKEQFTDMKIREWMGEEEYSTPGDLERKETVK